MKKNSRNVENYE